MKFKKKCLFRNQDHQDADSASIVESVWAYVITDDSGASKKAGRFRLRSSKFTQEQMSAMGLITESTDSDTSVFAVQGTTDLWTEQNGWLPCIDWIGTPTDTLLDIDELLLHQMESFLTGINIKTTNVVQPAEVPVEKPVSKAKPPVQPTSSNNDTDDDDDDGDWI